MSSTDDAQLMFVLTKVSLDQGVVSSIVGPVYHGRSLGRYHLLAVLEHSTIMHDDSTGLVQHLRLERNMKHA